MSFIVGSVGFGGRNSPQDVKVIQWMLQTAQWFYGRKIFRDAYGIAENGVLDMPTASAVKDVIDCPKLFDSAHAFVPPRTMCIFPMTKATSF